MGAVTHEQSLLRIGWAELGQRDSVVQAGQAAVAAREEELSAEREALSGLAEERTALAHGQVPPYGARAPVREAPLLRGARVRARVAEGGGAHDGE